MSERYRRHFDRQVDRSRSRSRYHNKSRKKHRYRDHTKSPSRTYRRYRRHSRSRSRVIQRRRVSYGRRRDTRDRHHWSPQSRSVEQISRISHSSDRSRSSDTGSYQSNDSQSQSKSDSSSSDPHYKFKRNQIIGKKYRVTKLLGDGTFGRVVEAEYNGELFAVKIIKAVPRYIESAKIEKSIIRFLNNKDKEDKWGLVRYVDSFNHYSNYCLVFKPLGMSLYDLMKKNEYVGYPLYLVRSFFEQILRAIGFIHSVGYTHTDLKPENILFQDRVLRQAVWQFKNQPKRVEIPRDDTVRIIDFGGATDEREHHSRVINTRQYRAPEVILGCCKWSYSSDVWSIGCIIVELLTGNLYFQTHEDIQHLRMIERHYGRLPFWMVNGSDQFRSLFDRQTGRMRWPRVATSSASIQRVNQMLTLQVLFPSDPQLVQLLSQCLEVDPQKRVTCVDALKHPFFRTKI